MRHILPLFTLAIVTLLSACSSVNHTAAAKSDAAVEIFKIKQEPASFTEKSRIYTITLASVSDGDAALSWSFLLPTEHGKAAFPDGRIYSAKTSSEKPYTSSYTKVNQGGEKETSLMMISDTVTNYTMVTEMSNLNVYKNDKSGFSYSLEVHMLHGFKEFAVNNYDNIMVPITSSINKEGFLPVTRSQTEIITLGDKVYKLIMSPANTIDSLAFFY